MLIQVSEVVLQLFCITCSFLKILAHTLASLEKLEKSDLARLVMDYQNKSDNVLNNINSELLDLKNKFTKLESDLKFPKMLIN